ncbi:MAG TPA: hypothetical protein VJ868_05220 [Actinomycetota bacterium]|nr:hypothetical protein [Actinomycetota bacterium]
MCWQAYRDLDGMRAQLREDIRASRDLGSVPSLVRFPVWGAIIGAALLLGIPAAACPGILLFEGAVAPLLARRPDSGGRLGPLRPWRVPDSYRESPESLPTSFSRP